MHGAHGIGKSDVLFLEMLDALSQSGSMPWTYQAIFTQIDRMTMAQITEVTETQEQLRKIAPTCLPPIWASSLTELRVGIDLVRESILEACDLETLD